MKQRGFTLIEMLIVIAVIGILAAIAVPNYRDYVIKSRRVDAKDALSAVQFSQEKWRGNNVNYTETFTSLGVSTTSPQGFYTLEVGALKNVATDLGITYVMAAKAYGVQATDDVACPYLVVTGKGFATDGVYTFNGVDVYTNGAAYKNCWGLK